MRTVYRAILKVAVFANIVLVTMPFAICWYLCYANEILLPYYRNGNFLLVALFVLLYIAFGHTYDAFLISYNRVFEMVYSQVLALLISDTAMYIVISLLSKKFVNFWYLLFTFGIQLLATAVWSFVSQKLYFAAVRPRKTAIIYDARPKVEELIRDYGLGKKFKVECVIPVDDCIKESMSALSGIEAVFVCGVHSHDRNIILKYCIEHDVRLFVIPRVGDVLMSSAKRMHMLHLPMLLVERYNPSVGYLFFKRLFDIVASIIALILTSPLFLVTAVAIKLCDGGPVFYRQCRVTKGEKRFYILKFRSMRQDAEKNGAQLSTGDRDERITPVGRVIRRLRIDELPQLFNILSGSMSIVGPRPERVENVEQYSKELPEFALRLQAKAGLTGYAQVYGKYNTTPYDKLQMDLMYIASPSVIEDLRIILATIKILFMPKSTEGFTEEEMAAMLETVTGKEENERNRVDKKTLPIEEEKKEDRVTGVTAFSEEHCIMCGTVIPEGRQVCIECEENVMHRVVREEE